jgi:secreted PhoX family phosphatase
LELMADFTRRAFLRRSAAYAGGTVGGFASLEALAAWVAANRSLRATRPEAQLGTGGYGPLRAAGPELALPEGFSYRVIGVEGSRMSDGYLTPGSHDGMAAFALPNGNIRLIRNHEVANPPRANASVGDPATAYDPGAGGGTVSLEIHPETRELIRDFVSLNGTWRNCAGGPTPWNTWLSCEEAFFGHESGFGATHGYIFEVPAALERAERSDPLTAMGRLVHEAVAVDPDTGIVYETEDHFRAGLYRFLPHVPYRTGERGDLRAGGRLQMLAIRDRPRYDTRTGQRAGRPLPAYWVDIEEPDPQGGPDDHSVVFEQGYARGGALFSRLEGCWYGNGSVYFDATDGGDAKLGQIWQYRPTGPDDGILTLILESPHRRVLNRPDNLCVSPRGALVICEDANTRRQYVRGLTPDGRVFDIATNIANDSELAGATFSPDGRTLFFNFLGNPARRIRGMTFAVWGPWELGAV